jgi:hypothetical protein
MLLLVITSFRTSSVVWCPEQDAASQWLRSAVSNGPQLSRCLPTFSPEGGKRSGVRNAVFCSEYPTTDSAHKHVQSSSSDHCVTISDTRSWADGVPLCLTSLLVYQIIISLCEKSPVVEPQCAHAQLWCEYPQVTHRSRTYEIFYVTARAGVHGTDPLQTVRVVKEVSKYTGIQ